jgi:hypothetical protein
MVNMGAVCFNCHWQFDNLISGVCDDCHREFFDGHVKIKIDLKSHFGEITVKYSLQEWRYEQWVSHVDWNYSSNHKSIHDRAYANYLEWDKSRKSDGK